MVSLCFFYDFPETLPPNSDVFTKLLIPKAIANLGRKMLGILALIDRDEKAELRILNIVQFNPSKYSVN